MPTIPEGDDATRDPRRLSKVLLWLSGAWIVPLLGAALWLSPAGPGVRLFTIALAVLLAPIPALIALDVQRRRLRDNIAKAKDAGERLKLQLETVRYRTSRLREELSAADKQARLAHQLTLLGQFTAGFMHEFNNPLAIVTSRIEVLLEERKEDAALCADLQQ